MQNIVHTFSSVKTSPETLKSLAFDDFEENYALFLSRLRYFDVKTPFALHYARKNVVHAFFVAETSPDTRKLQ